MAKFIERKADDFANYLFHQGKNYNIFEYLGAHRGVVGGVEGVFFRVWAPRAKGVSVVGDFNGWNENANPMSKISTGGIYETFIEGIKPYSLYKFAVKGKRTILKSDPCAFYSEKSPKTASVVYDIDGYRWSDGDYIKKKTPLYDKPINIYEVNLASWKRKESGDYYSYIDYAKELVSYVKKAGYTHVEFMPLTEYPFDGSWGYQVTGYFSITSRFGEPKDFMYLVDEFHKNDIGVILDWVPSHFPKDEHGLYEFDGHCQYEYSDKFLKEHKTWGTRLFDWGRNEVQSFLISSAVFLFEKFHIDGLRVDAVSSMLYRDYDRKDGEWSKNVNGGSYNLEAINFLQNLNTYIFEKFPNALMIAEESTSFPMVTAPVSKGGLGFNFKWNMGWMNDSLYYMGKDPYFRSGIHDKLTFSMCYAFSENFILPISHDEVVHGKKSLLDKMPNSVEDKFSNLRAFNAYQFAHPGKKLTFMGSEYGQFKEWNYTEGLEFFMLKFPLHSKLLEYNFNLNNIYKNTPSLYENDSGWQGFEWISPDEKDNNVISFKRKDKNGNTLVFIANFSGNDYYNYRLGLEEGGYKVLLCSDDKKYGGSGKLKGRTFRTVKKSAHGKENSIKFNLPRLSAIYFTKFE